ncbi:MAG: site-specific DNA-methyltransferase [Acidimicrobiia bacterium]|nr:site-specific DNA-methyltransferase [Acidimicrobiia bacterium]
MRAEGGRGATGRTRRPTRTSAFGVGRREAHDATPFYGRFDAPLLMGREELAAQAPAPCPPGVIDAIHVGDSRTDMGPVPDNSVALVVTSPPYYAGKEYEAALGEGHIPGSYVEYLAMLHAVFAECWRVLEPGGRIAVNVANLGRKPYRSLSADVTRLLEGELGFLLRGEVLWVKAQAASGNCAWGSFGSAANPVLRDVTERIVVASKGRFERAPDRKARRAQGLPWEDTISRDEFMALTLDTWRFPPESARRVGHPAPFPVELPRRAIELFTFKGDTVLDPWCGSASHAVAALRTGRHFVGFDIDAGYVGLARARIAEEQASSDAPPLFEG